MGPDGMSMVNGTTGVHGEEYWTDGGNMSQVRPSSPQAQAQGQSQAQPQRQVSDVYSNTLPVRRPAPAKNKNPVGKSPDSGPNPRAPEPRCLSRELGSGSPTAGRIQELRSRYLIRDINTAWKIIYILTPSCRL